MKIIAQKIWPRCEVEVIAVEGDPRELATLSDLEHMDMEDNSIR